MKFHTYILFLCLTLLSTTLFAQDAKNEKFTSTVFKVFGACEECKDRIELAIKGRGVRLGIWNVETKMLILEYDSTVISLEKIQNKILSVGHDLETKKANDKVYNSLDACCRYREIAEDEVKRVKGVVLQENAKGKFEPMPNASVYWLGTGKGVVTDSLGVFEINTDTSTQKLVISYTGFKADTLTVVHANDLKVIMSPSCEDTGKGFPNAFLILSLLTM